LNPDFVNALKSSQSFNTALGFVRSNGGVPENILEANRINVQAYSGKSSQIQALRDTTQMIQPQQIVQSQAIPFGFTPAPQYSFQTGQNQPWAPQSSSFNQPAYRPTSFQYTSPATSNLYTYQPSSTLGYQPVRIWLNSPKV